MSLLDRVGRFLDDVVLLPEETRKDLAAAEAARADGLWPQAESLYRAILDGRPSLVAAQMGLAQTLAVSGQLAEARAWAGRARRLSPDDATPALLAARWALEDGDAEAACEAAAAATRLLVGEGGAAFGEACVLRAQAERASGRPDRAARELEKALSVSPDDPSLALSLLDALVASGERRRTRAVVRRLSAAELEPAHLVAAADACRRADLSRDAATLYGRAVEAGERSALLPLARIALEAGQLSQAEAYARQAVAAGCDALPVLAEVLVAQGDFAQAAEVYEAAARVSTGASEGLWREALRLTSLRDVEALSRRCAGLPEGDGERRVAEAAVALERGVDALTLGPDASSPRASIVRAMAELRAGRPEHALSALEARLRAEAAVAAEAAGPDAALARELRREALWGRFRDAGGWVDVGALMAAVARFASERGFGALAAVADDSREALDRPLLLAVMGEFNAGKSTLINALVGVEIAPMGVVPTTASLNVLRAGAARRVVVVAKDGSTREGGFERLPCFLAEAEAEGAAPVDHVEIMLPSSTLEQVWILDTPGLNALDPRHAELARDAARRADAVLWVFDAAQAGKATEAASLRAVRRSGRPVLAVLNKSDRLQGGERARVVEALRESLGEGASPVVVSARRALRARVRGEGAADGPDGFDALHEALQERIVSRARPLKRRASALRLSEALEQARAESERRALPLRAQIAGLTAAREALTAIRLDEVLTDALRALERSRDAAFTTAAEEVLAFARPRQEFWGKNGAEPEDRVFLEGLLERHLATASERSRRALTGELTARIHAALGESRGQLPEVHGLVAAALLPAFAALTGFERGLRAGGALRRFFDERLPRAELSVASLRRDLARARADLEAELAPALRAAAAEVLEGLVAAVDRSLADARRRLILTERDELEPLAAFAALVGAVLSPQG